MEKKIKTSLESTNQIIVLFDSDSNFEDLKILLQQKIPKTIITFDYETHKLLSKNNIKHGISDDYLHEEDIHFIDKKSRFMSTQWCSDPSITDLVTYERINLAHLFYVEFHYFLVPFLKKFIEVTKIFKKYENQKFTASSILFKIIKSFTSSVDKLSENESKINLLYDKMEYEFKIWNIPFNISLSRKKFFKLKMLTEKFIQIFFGSNKIITNHKKNSFLVEFNTLKYKNIFSASQNSKVNLVFFGRRRPAIWNYSTFSIIKNSNCSIITNYSVSKKNLQSSINKGQSQLTKLKLVWNMDEFFNTFFSYNGFSFWNIIKPTFIELFEKRMNEAIIEIEFTKKTLDKFKPSSILVLGENGPNEQIIINLANRQNITTLLVQHGLFYDTSEAYDFNKFAGVYPFHSDKMLVWGKLSERYLLKSGFPPSKINSFGSPAHDEFFQRKIKSNHKKNNFILLATTSPVKNMANDLTVKTRDLYEETIRTICQVICKLDKQLVIKLHPFQEEIDVTPIVKEVNPKITIIHQGEILPLIESCEVFLVIDLSTTMLEAQILKKPVISISVKDYGWGIPEIFKSKSVLRTNKDDFESVLISILEDKEFKQQIIEKGCRFVNESFTNQTTASSKILSFLENT